MSVAGERHVVRNGEEEVVDLGGVPHVVSNTYDWTSERTGVEDGCEDPNDGIQYELGVHPL